MAGKLKSITKGIPWFLVFKSLAVFFAWVLLPEWMAWVLGAFFYFSSFFRARHMGLPIFISFLLVHVLGRGVLSATILGVLFFLVLGLKELVFIDRRFASTVMIFLILSTAGFLLYENLDAWSAWTPVKTLIFAWSFWVLSGGFLDRKELSGSESPLALGVTSFLLFEVATIIAFLPLDFIYQAAITVFIAFVFFEWLVSRAERGLGRNKILLYSSFLFILVTLIFSFAKWSI